MRTAANNPGTGALQHEHSSDILSWTITETTKTGFLKITARPKPSVHHDLTTNVTILSPIKHRNDTEAASHSWAVIWYSATFIFPSIFYSYDDAHCISQGPRRFMGSIPYKRKQYWLSVRVIKEQELDLYGFLLTWWTVMRPHWASERREDGQACSIVEPSCDEWFPLTFHWCCHEC